MHVEHRLETEQNEDGISRVRASLLGFGLLIAANAAFFGSLELPLKINAESDSFGILVAFLACGCIGGVALPFVLRLSHTSPVKIACLAGGAYTLSMASIALTSSGDLFSMSPIASGLLGTCDVVLYLMWGRALSTVPPRKALLHCALSAGFGSFVGTTLAEFTPLGTSLLGAAALGLVSIESLRKELSSNPPESTLPDSQKADRYREMVSFLWKPIFGGFACAFIVGLSWIAPGDGTSSNWAVSLFSGLAASIALAGFVFFSKRTFNLAAFFQIVLPVAAITLLVIPFLDVPDESAMSLLVQVTNNFGFSLLDIAVITALAAASYVSNVPSDPAFGIQRALGSAAMLLGLAAGMLIDHSILQTICALVLATYTAAVVVSIVRHGMRPLGSNQSESEATIEDRCVVLSDQFELSPRESEILTYLGRGRGSTYIGEELFISVHTVKTHTKHIHEKMGVHSREELLDLIDERKAGPQSDPAEKNV